MKFNKISDIGGGGIGQQPQTLRFKDTLQNERSFLQEIFDNVKAAESVVGYLVYKWAEPSNRICSGRRFADTTIVALLPKRWT